jgi:cytochrome c-type biogenesis protein CcmH/NrfF
MHNDPAETRDKQDEPAAAIPAPGSGDSPTASQGRRCAACKYDLTGLEGDLRCPECGLQNIPEGFRQRIWDDIDSGKRFHAGPFAFFRKRPPEWWWALDRPDDLRRSTWYALRTLLFTFIVVTGAVVAADSVCYRSNVAWSTPAAAGQPARYWRHESITRDMWVGTYWNYTPISQAEAASRPGGPGKYCAIRPRFQPELICFTWLVPVMAWCLPGWVGLWTQHRRRMPQYAKPAHTVLAATNYEVYRLWYTSGAIVLFLALDVLGRADWAVSLREAEWITAVLTILYCLPAALAMLGWIGPLRSDDTGQLILSRGHALRIFTMYVVPLPVIAAFTILLFILTVVLGPFL